MAKAGVASVQTRFPIRGWFAESHPLFRQELLALARPKSHAAGSVIYQADELGLDVFGISSGVVTLQSRLTHPVQVADGERPFATA
jgi:CRP-like cAMP-binding protein